MEYTQYEQIVESHLIEQGKDKRFAASVIDTANEALEVKGILLHFNGISGENFEWNPANINASVSFLDHDEYKNIGIMNGSVLYQTLNTEIIKQCLVKATDNVKQTVRSNIAERVSFNSKAEEMGKKWELLFNEDSELKYGLSFKVLYPKMKPDYYSMAYTGAFAVSLFNADNNVKQRYNEKAVIEAYRQIRDAVNQILPVGSDKHAYMHTQAIYPDKSPYATTVETGENGHIAHGVDICPKSFMNETFFKEYGRELAMRINEIADDGRRFVKRGFSFF